jgi:hypothetical protein
MPPRICARYKGALQPNGLAVARNPADWIRQRILGGLINEYEQVE